ncbi:phage small tail protein E [Pantoea stewartii]|uniref:Phage small tail protein E n=2 Tax=Pantoea stewartii TaxID=66269 RepID=A0AB34VK86_9GAMM|nr:phage small tail protein E [Pantoea stewartii]KTS99171.1 phage small tail protein E [Pantoea stewartii]KTT07313.1 phage small tail protein E [Pantoea stewartii]
MKELLLSKPVMAAGETLSVLEIREPTYDEVEQFGIPFSYTEAGEMKLDSRVTLKYIPVLAGIPRSSAAKLTLKDVFMASMTIVGFFTGSETAETSEPDSTTPRTSGA